MLGAGGEGREQVGGWESPTTEQSLKEMGMMMRGSSEDAGGPQGMNI